jgi:hypothetical protein
MQKAESGKQRAVDSDTEIKRQGAKVKNQKCSRLPCVSMLWIGKTDG